MLAQHINAITTRPLRYSKFFRFIKPHSTNEGTHTSVLTTLLLACLWLSTLTAPTPAQAQDTAVSMGWEDWRPYQFRDDSGTIKGLDVDIVSSAFAAMNRNLDLVELPWKRHLLNIESGRTDLAASASRTSEREAYAYYSEPYRTESAALFIRTTDRERFAFDSLADIIGTDFKLAVTRGYYYGEEFSRLMKDDRFRSRVREVNDNQLAQRQLARGRVDGFLEDPIAATQELKTEGLLEQTFNLLTVYSDDIFVMFSKKTMTETDVAAFNEALQQLREDGTYQSIYERYLPHQNN